MTRVVFWKQVRILGVRSSLEGEALAFFCALHNSWILGRMNVWFESDSLELTKTINIKSQSVDLECESLLEDIRYWMSLLPEYAFRHIERKRNQAADIIAKKVVVNPNSFVVYNIAPIWLIEYLNSSYTI